MTPEHLTRIEAILPRVEDWVSQGPIYTANSERAILTSGAEQDAILEALGILREMLDAAK